MTRTGDALEEQTAMGKVLDMFKEANNVVLGHEAAALLVIAAVLMEKG